MTRSRKETGTFRVVGPETVPLRHRQGKPVFSADPANEGTTPNQGQRLSVRPTPASQTGCFARRFAAGQPTPPRCVALAHTLASRGAVVPGQHRATAATADAARVAGLTTPSLPPGPRGRHAA